jgi:GT2 family glycosyltransferase
MKKVKLSIIILNYNTRELLENCLNSIKACMDEVGLEVIVSDNSSSDGSPEMVKNEFPWVRLMEGPNISFSNGNNRARNVVKGEFVLLLNSDTLLHKNTLAKTVEYLEKNKDVGVVTCKLILANGKLDKDARRRFPTPWISFKRLFLKNAKEYWYEDISEDKSHEVDSVEGAFLLTRKSILDKVNWLDENYLFDGEDIDLCFRIKKLGYKIVYFPAVSITHLKGASKGKINEIRKSLSPALVLKRRMDGVNSMEYFYRKNLWSSYPLVFDYFVLIGIKLLKVTRYLQVKFS